MLFKVDELRTGVKRCAFAGRLHATHRHLLEEGLLATVRDASLEDRNTCQHALRLPDFVRAKWRRIP